MVTVSSYNVISEQDPDILNQGSIKHIKNYFERLESNNINNNYESNKIIITESKKSINNISFFIKLILLLIFLYIVCDFINNN